MYAAEYTRARTLFVSIFGITQVSSCFSVFRTVCWEFITTRSGWALRTQLSTSSAWWPWSVTDSWLNTGRRSLDWHWTQTNTGNIYTHTVRIWLNYCIFTALSRNLTFCIDWPDFGVQYFATFTLHNLNINHIKYRNIIYDRQICNEQSCAKVCTPLL